jgi:hypothetical protein
VEAQRAPHPRLKDIGELKTFSKTKRQPQNSCKRSLIFFSCRPCDDLVEKVTHTKMVSKRGRNSWYINTIYEKAQGGVLG